MDWRETVMSIEDAWDVAGTRIIEHYSELNDMLFEQARRTWEAAQRAALFQRGQFTLHSGATSDFKIDCDALTDEDWAALAQEAAKVLPPFGVVIGVPTGGIKFAAALEAYKAEGAERVLIADDVLTTGRSMEEKRSGWAVETIGVVAFARGPVPDWITPLFTTWNPNHGKPVNEGWASNFPQHSGTWKGEV
jgi:hypothetical protein